MRTKIPDGAEATRQVNPKTEQVATLRAKDRARNARWDLNIAIFLFAVLILVIILATYTKAGIEIVAPVALVGLGIVWLTGWRRGKQLYHRFYEEELSRLELESEEAVKAALNDTVGITIEETIDEKVQKALRERWR